MHSVGAGYYLVDTRSMKIVPSLWYKMACKSLPLHSFLSQLSCSLLYIVHNITHPVYFCFIMTVLQITQLNSFYKYLSLEIRGKNSQKCALLPIITKFGTQEIDRLSHLPGFQLLTSWVSGFSSWPWICSSQHFFLKMVKIKNGWRCGKSLLCF